MPPPAPRHISVAISGGDASPDALNRSPGPCSAEPETAALGRGVVYLSVLPTADQRAELRSGRTCLQHVSSRPWHEKRRQVIRIKACQSSIVLAHVLSTVTPALLTRFQPALGVEHLLQTRCSLCIRRCPGHRHRGALALSFPATRRRLRVDANGRREPGCQRGVSRPDPARPPGTIAPLFRPFAAVTVASFSFRSLPVSCRAIPAHRGAQVGRSRTPRIISCPSPSGASCNSVRCVELVAPTCRASPSARQAGAGPASGPLPASDSAPSPGPGRSRLALGVAGRRRCVFTSRRTPPPPPLPPDHRATSPRPRPPHRAFRVAENNPNAPPWYGMTKQNTIGPK